MELLPWRRAAASLYGRNGAGDDLLPAAVSIRRLDSVGYEDFTHSPEESGGCAQRRTEELLAGFVMPFQELNKAIYRKL